MAAFTHENDRKTMENDRKTMENMENYGKYGKKIQELMQENMGKLWKKNMEKNKK